MVPGRFLVTFGHMNTLQKESNCFLVGKSRTWPPLILTTPFITQKKFVHFIRFRVLKTTGLSSRFQRKNQFWKICIGSWDIDQMCPNSGRQTKSIKFWVFWLISQDSMHVFQNRFLCWNRKLKPVVLSTMNPIKGTTFFLSYKRALRILKRKSTHLKFWKFYFFKLILVLCI